MNLATLNSHLTDAPQIFSWDAGDIRDEHVRFGISCDRDGAIAVDDTRLDIRVFVQQKLFEERGFCILRLSGASDLNDDALISASNLLAEALGRRLRQNRAGDLYYRVEDSGAFGQNGFRFSQTSKTTTMHTDCSYGDNRPDVISLFCVNPAAHGGISQVCSIYRSMNVMRAEHPEMIETFLHDFYFHRRNTNLAGEADVHKYRLLELKGGQLSIRYKRPYMEFGHQYAGIEMPVAANRCFDELDRISGSDAAAYSYALKRGDCLIANNMWVLHNRTDYQDADEAPPRLVIRHWLQFPRDERRQSLLM